MSISIDTRLEQLKYLLAVAQADDHLTMQEVLAINEFMKQFPELEAMINFSETVNVEEINFDSVTDEIVFNETIKLMERVAKSDGNLDASKSRVIDTLKQQYETYKLALAFDAYLSHYSEFELKQIAECYEKGFAVSQNENTARAIFTLLGDAQVVSTPVRKAPSPTLNVAEEPIEKTAVESVKSKKSYSEKLNALRDKVGSSNYVN